jgi:LysR family transcriptional regulator, transcriptional activator for bauABCD operon
MSLRRPLPDFTDYDLRLLRVFDAVVRGGGFAGAEVILNKGKSAISTDIACLETRLGVTLCRRGRSGFSPTNQGRKIHELSLDLFRQLREFRHQADLVVSVDGGELAVAMDSNLPQDCAEYFSVVLERFQSKHPQVAVRIDAAAPEQVTQWVLDGSTHFGIGTIPRNLPALRSVLLFAEQIALFCGKSCPLYGIPAEELDDAQLGSVECLILPAWYGAASRIAGNCLHLRSRARTVEAQNLLVSTGRAMGYLPYAYAQRAVERKTLWPVHPGKLSFRCEVRIFARPEVARSTACEQLEAEILEIFGPCRDRAPAQVIPMMWNKARASG